MLLSEDVTASLMSGENVWEDSFWKFLVSGGAVIGDADNKNGEPNHSILSQIFNQSPIGMIIVQPDHSIAFVNRIASSLFGFDHASEPTIPWAELRSRRRLFDDDSKPLSDKNDPIRMALKDRKRTVSNILMKSADGEHEHWVAVTCFPILDPSDEKTVIAGVATMIDITDFKGMQEILYHQATHDPLTGLSNKAFLSAGMYKALARAKRESTCGAVLFLDVDKFKRVNDSLGHAAGDDLLVKVADRISSEVRDTDIVARVGGDEFVILLADIHKGDDLKVASDVAERICRSISKPFVIWGNEAYVTISIGISLYPGHGMDEGTLLQRADEAMYQVKENGRNGWRFWGNIYD